MFCIFQAIPGTTQGLFLVLCSGVSPVAGPGHHMLCRGLNQSECPNHSTFCGAPPMRGFKDITGGQEIWHNALVLMLANRRPRLYSCYCKLPQAPSALTPEHDWVWSQTKWWGPPETRQSSLWTPTEIPLKPSYGSETTEKISGSLFLFNIYLSLINIHDQSLKQSSYFN